MVNVRTWVSIKQNNRSSDRITVAKKTLLGDGWDQISPMPDRVDRRLGPIPHPKLADDRAHMTLHRFARDEQRLGDLLVGLT